MVDIIAYGIFGLLCVFILIGIISALYSGIKCADINSTRLALVCGETDKIYKTEKLLGYYHLRPDKSLVLRSYSEDNTSVMVWPFLAGDHFGHQRICNEALDLGADKNRVKELKYKWKVY